MANPSYLALATLRGSVLYSNQLADTSATTIYTAPASSGVKIASLALHNTSAAAVTVSVSVVPTGGTAAATNRVISGYSLAAGDTLSLADYLGGAFLGEGDFISVTAGTGAVLNAVLTGTVAA